MNFRRRNSAYYCKVCAKVMKEGIVPPTINLDNPDIEAGCDLDYVPNVAYTFPADKMPRAVLSDNLGFGKWFSSID